MNIASAHQGIFVFAAITILLSLNIGLFFLNSFLFVGIAIVTTYFLRKYIIPFSIPTHIILLAILMGGLTVFPIVLRGNAAADATQTIILRVLTDHIPATFAPYSNLALNYQFSYHLFTKALFDLFPIVPDYIFLALLAVVLAALEVFSVYVFTFTITSNNKAATWAVVLLFGTKALFRDVLVGGYHTIIAINFLLLAFTYFLKKGRLQYLFFPLAIACHPHIGAFALVLFVIYVSIFRNRTLDFLRLLPTILLIIPVLLTTYLALFLGVVVASDGLQPSISLTPFFFALIPLYIGIVPSLFCVFGFILYVKNNARTKEQFFAFVLLASIIAIYTVLGLLHFDFLAKIFELGTIAALLFAGITISDRLPRWVIALALVLCVASTLGSGELNRYRYQENAPDDELAFAHAFYEYDPSLQTTFIFSEPGIAAKIAEYGNKIPYDVRVNWYLPYDKKQVFQDEGLAELESKHQESLGILNSSCGQCAATLGVTYIVVDRTHYQVTDIGSPVFSQGKFDVYRKPF